MTTNEILRKLDEDTKVDHWESVQVELPGITKEEYETGLAESANYIREKYYSEAGYLKPRLVKK